MANTFIRPKLELVTECDECPCLDTRAITFQHSMLQRIPAFMHNKVLGKALW